MFFPVQLISTLYKSLIDLCGVSIQTHHQQLAVEYFSVVLSQVYRKAKINKKNNLHNLLGINKHRTQ
jgi:hypothetical protein